MDIGEASTTTKVFMCENQCGPVNSSATISCEEPMLLKTSPSFTPKPVVSPNQPPKVFSPGFFILQSASETDSQHQYSAVNMYQLFA